MKRTGPLTGADARPRIHVWPETDGHRISFGPVGQRSSQLFASVPHAVERDGMHAGGFDKGAVIIVEPRL